MRFGRLPAAAALAPGRVNLIGEHTDYNDGLVLPCAIDRACAVIAAPRADGRVRAYSREQRAEACFALGPLRGAAPRAGDWLDYVRAPALALQEAGHRLRGADLAIASDVPLGAGLSSSAALGVSVTLALAQVSGISLSRREVADLAHRAESHFVGTGCGVLDQYASALGEPDRALRIDCRARSVAPIALPANAVWLVADSGTQRELARVGYRERLAECAAALDAAQRAGIAKPAARALRDLTPERPARARTRAAGCAAAPRAPCDPGERPRGCVRERPRCRRSRRRRRADAREPGEPALRLRRLDARARRPVRARRRRDRLLRLAAHRRRLRWLHPAPRLRGSRGERGAALAEGFAQRFGRTQRVWRVRASAGASVRAIS